MPTPSRRSPIDGSPQEPKTLIGFTSLVFYEHELFGRLILTNALDQCLRFGSDLECCKDRYSKEEIGAAMDVVRSYIWRVGNLSEPPMVVVTDAEFKELDGCITSDDGQTNLHCRAIGSLVREARALTLHEKAMKTLEAIAAMWERTLKMVQLPGASVTSNRGFEFTVSDNVSGLAFGCNATETKIVLDLLFGEEYLRTRLMEDQRLRFLSDYVLTPKAFRTIDERMRNGVERRLVFFVRPHNHPQDALLREAVAEAEWSLNCRIEAVWDKEHNERIDERIFRRIQEAAVVLVDVTGERFNVALELGYALALGKPVVLIRLKSEKDLPFDIGTLNCYDYEADKLAELIGKLKARIGCAIPAS